MKNMKKLLAALMTAMVLVMVAPAAFAEDVQPEQTAPEVQAPAEEAKPEATAEPEATAASEATAEATVEVQPEVTPIPEATVDAQSETTPAPEATRNDICDNEMCHNGKCIVIVVSDSSSLQVGDTMTLTAKFCCFDCVEYQLNWQVKTENGNWENLAYEHSQTLKIKLVDQSIGCQWRVVVETAD